MPRFNSSWGDDFDLEEVLKKDAFNDGELDSNTGDFLWDNSFKFTDDEVD